MASGLSDGVLLAARLSLATLFMIFGRRKLRDYSGTVAQMARDGLPMPGLASAVAIFMELPVSLAIMVGVFTRPAAILFVLYTLATSLIEHRYWTTTAADRVESMEQFYKNLSIAGGFLLLSITGPGSYSIDVLYGIANRQASGGL